MTQTIGQNPQASRRHDMGIPTETRKQVRTYNEKEREHMLLLITNWSTDNFN